jgi:hypothetical protein
VIFLLSRKGFIGPIGDDLPSLIPIVTGLVIFFTVFVLTFNSYHEKNNFLERQINMTTVARDIKGDSLILNWSQFDDRCNEMKLRRYPYSFMIAIYDNEVDLGRVVGDFNRISLDDGYERVLSSENEFSFLGQYTDKGGGEYKNFFCSYLKIGGRDFSESKRQYIVRFYPIAVQQPMEVNTKIATTQFLIVPAVMAMVVWE